MSLFTNFGNRSVYKVEIYYDLYFKDLVLDLTTFRKTLVSLDPLQETYSNHQTGIVYSVYEGKVAKIYYNQSGATCKILREKLTKEKPMENNKKEN